jgi:hypothetical protein
MRLRIGKDLNPRPEAGWRLIRLHVETAIALQIALATGELRAGRYRRGEDQRDWQRDGN